MLLISAGLNMVLNIANDIYYSRMLPECTSVSGSEINNTVCYVMQPCLYFDPYTFSLPYWHLFTLYPSCSASKLLYWPGSGQCWPQLMKACAPPPFLPGRDVQAPQSAIGWGKPGGSPSGGGDHSYSGQEWKAGWGREWVMEEIIWQWHSFCAHHVILWKSRYMFLFVSGINHCDSKACIFSMLKP